MHEGADHRTDPAAEDLRRLRDELGAAEAAVRDAEAEAGLLRGQIVELKVQLGRARQEQEWAMTHGPSRWSRTKDLWVSTQDRLRQRLAR